MTREGRRIEEKNQSSAKRIPRKRITIFKGF